MSFSLCICCSIVQYQSIAAGASRKHAVLETIFSEDVVLTGIMEVGSGLDGCEQFMDVNDMIRDEDLLGHRGAAHTNGEASARDFFVQPQPHKQEVHELVATMVPGGLSRTLSARERNMLKRKAKVLPKDGAKEWGEEEEVEEPTAKRTKQTKSVMSEQAQGGDTKVC